MDYPCPESSEELKNMTRSGPRKSKRFSPKRDPGPNMTFLNCDKMVIREIENECSIQHTHLYCKKQAAILFFTKGHAMEL